MSFTTTTPYYRIHRPFLAEPFPSASKTGYLLDPRYAPDRCHLIRGYHYLQHDLQEFFQFVEPADQNLTCYSHRLYALLLRAATEFETNAKAILAANGYSKLGDWNINDYWKINRALKLEEYSLTIPHWSGSSQTIKPFAEWATKPTLCWYRDYNAVKHNRMQEFHRATFQNVVTAVGAVFAVVFSQFHIHSLEPRGETSWHQTTSSGGYAHPSCLFEVEPASTWTDADHYNFVWTKLSSSASPFQQFSF